MKLLLIGNCQVRPVAEFLQLISSDIEILGKIIVHLAKDSDLEKDLARYSEADIILAQQVANTYPVKHVSTDYIKNKYRTKVVTWVNVFFQGQNPDLFYVSGEDGKRINGPTDIYHSKALIDLWSSGTSAKQVHQYNYLSQTTSAEMLRERVNRSLINLEKRENGVDICMYDYIAENWKSKPLFHTFNHPNLITMVELCNRICKKLDLPSIDQDIHTLTDRLSLIVPPNEENMTRELGMMFTLESKIHGLQVSEDRTKALPGKRVIYDFSEFVETAFSCYDAQKRCMNTLSYTPA